MSTDTGTEITGADAPDLLKKEKTIYLIDGSAYIYRAYHAIRNLSNSKGLPTNAVFGFSRMLIKLIKDKKPEYVVMFFDAKGPTFRHEIYDLYKANRPPMPDDLSVQIPYIKKVTEGFNIHTIEMPGFEADDLIGTMARKAEDAAFSVVMVTGDKDFLQLVTDNSIVWDPMKDKATDIDLVRKSFGVEPQQMIEVMGLSGDTADNIPGVPGIGQKTALSLIKTYGSIKHIYEQIDSITKKKQKENLIQYKDQAFLSRELVTINTNTPLSFDVNQFQLKSPDNDKLSELYKALEFRQLRDSVRKKTDLSKKKYTAVMDMETLSDIVKQLETSEVIAVDTETTSQNPMEAKLVGLSFSVKPNEAVYIPCTHDYLDAPEQLGLKTVLDLLKPILENPDIKKIGQNIKYDWIVLNRHGISLEGVFFDTMIASYLNNPSIRAHSLDQIALDLLDHQTIKYDDVIKTENGKKLPCFSRVPVEKAIPYACEDADITFMAYTMLMPILKKTGLRPLFNTIEMPLVSVLKNMEMRGICVNREKLRSLSRSFEHQLDLIEKEIYLLAGEEFNIRSSQQLGTILFEKLKLPVQKKTKKKTGYSTDVDVLKNLSSRHELPAMVLRHRTLAKLKSTYTDALSEMVHPETNRIHTSFNQTITATGRLSSSSPNLQNIPIRTAEGKEIRSAFIPRDGWMLVAADYSQIELRILAHCSEDNILIQAFMDDDDIHTRTAEEVFQVFPAMITPDLRRQAKVINFGIIYGMSPYGLSKELDISQKMAKNYINSYFARYKGVKKFIDRTINTARETGMARTLFDRIRHLPDINSSNRNIRLFAERVAVNTPIQGSAADLMKLAMIKVHESLKEKNLKSTMLLTVHDELVFEVPQNELEITTSLVKDVMEHVWEIKVPLKVNVDWGKNWAEAH